MVFYFPKYLKIFILAHAIFLVVYSVVVFHGFESIYLEFVDVHQRNIQNAIYANISYYVVTVIVLSIPSYILFLLCIFRKIHFPNGVDGRFKFIGMIYLLLWLGSMGHSYYYHFLVMKDLHIEQIQNQLQEKTVLFQYESLPVTSTRVGQSYSKTTVEDVETKQQFSLKCDLFVNYTACVVMAEPQLNHKVHKIKYYTYAESNGFKSHFLFDIVGHPKYNQRYFAFHYSLEWYRKTTKLYLVSFILLSQTILFFMFLFKE